MAISINSIKALLEHATGGPVQLFRKPGNSDIILRFSASVGPDGCAYCGNEFKPDDCACASCGARLTK